MANKRNKKQPLKRAGAIKKTKGKKKAPKAAAKPKVEKVAVKVKGKQNAVPTVATTEKSNVEPKEKGETSLVEDNESPAATSSSSE
uniref:Uncharacterized protein n=1 Tax=Ditylenchus dipsaci TaxID=166011 RepID=A0A915DSN7_9BILA